jgi:type I restriction enzyme S subunit
MSEKINVPRLRFPEFADQSLLSTILEEVATLQKGKGISKSDIEEDGKTECIRYGELYTDYNEVISKVLSKTNLEPNSLILSEGNEVIIPASGESAFDIATASCVLKKGVALGGDLNIIRSDHNGVFLAFYLNNKRKKEIASLAQGISVVHLYGSQLKTLQLNLPSLPEQQKIAEFLTAVDRRIELLQAKKEKLEAYKKGVMQKIFPSTGSGTPKLRFKADDGSDFPDWEERKLGEVYGFRTTNSLSRDKLNYDSGEYRNIHYGDIHTKFPTLLDLKKVELPFVNEDIEIRKTFSENLVDDGDLLIADASEDYADIGKTIEVVNVNGEKVLAGLHTLHAKRIEANIEVGFGGFLMKSELIRGQIMKIAQGTKVLSISVPRMRELDLRLPCLQEQKKIVAFLTSLDRSIENLNQQITHTQTWKKGLLQKMFV